MGRPAPAALSSVVDPAARECLRELFAVLPATAVAGPTPLVWYDRGDPAASDWDETDLTEDAGWHDLDLRTAGVPSHAKLVLLRVVMVTGAESGVAYFRREGCTNAINASAVLEISDDQARDVWVTPAGGLIEYMLDFTGALSIDVTVGGWWA